MSSSSPKLWAYTYRLIPPLAPERLRALRTLLAREQKAAVSRDGVWQGRLVVDDRVSHILVVSDSSDLDDQVNRRLASALHTLDTDYAITLPLAVGDPHTRARKTAVQPPDTKD
jgi:hypothetical protein